MKHLISILSILTIFAFSFQTIDAQTSRTRTSTVIRASQTMLDTMTNADTLTYIFPGRSNPFVTQVHFAWTNLSGTIRDTVTIYIQAPSAVRLNTTNTTTGTTTTGCDYNKWGSFIVGATGLAGGVKDTSFSFSCNGAANLKFYHKSTGTQSTRVKANAYIYTASNQRAQ